MAKASLDKAKNFYRCLLCRATVNGKNRDQHKKLHQKEGFFSPATEFGYAAAVGLIINREGWRVIRQMIAQGTWDGPQGDASAVSAEWNRKGRVYEEWTHSFPRTRDHLSLTEFRAQEKQRKDDAAKEQIERWAREDAAAAAAEGATQ